MVGDSLVLLISDNSAIASIQLDGAASNSKLMMFFHVSLLKMRSVFHLSLPSIPLCLANAVALSWRVLWHV